MAPASRAEVREVKIERGNRQLSISDVLELTVAEPVRLFQHDVDVVRALQPLADVGAGLRQAGAARAHLVRWRSAATETGGPLWWKRPSKPARRASAWHAKARFFMFDEPTTGLHFDDIAKLMRAFGKLLDAATPSS